MLWGASRARRSRCYETTGQIPLQRHVVSDTFSKRTTSKHTTQGPNAPVKPARKYNVEAMSPGASTPSTMTLVMAKELTWSLEESLARMAVLSRPIMCERSRLTLFCFQAPVCCGLASGSYVASMAMLPCFNGHASSTYRKYIEYV